MLNQDGIDLGDETSHYLPLTEYESWFEKFRCSVPLEGGLFFTFEPARVEKVLIRCDRVLCCLNYFKSVSFVAKGLQFDCRLICYGLLVAIAFRIVDLLIEHVEKVVIF